MNTQLSVTITGKNIGELAASAMAFAQSTQTATKLGATPAATTTKKKAASAPVEETLDDGLLDETPIEAADGDDAIESFDDLPEETPAPAATKGKKITEKEVNQAALAHSKTHTRPKTLELLNKHFKVKSISELKPEQYAKVLTVLKV